MSDTNHALYASRSFVIRVLTKKGKVQHKCEVTGYSAAIKQTKYFKDLYANCRVQMIWEV